MTPEQRSNAVKRAKELLQEKYSVEGVVPLEKQNMTAYAKAYCLLFPPNFWMPFYPPKGFFIDDMFDNLKEAARENKHAHRTINKIAAEWIRSQHTPPKKVSDWAADILLGSISEPAKQGKPKDRQRRQIFWQVALKIHEEYSIAYDKNVVSEHENYVFSIVSEAAMDLGMSRVTENTVRKAFKFYNSPR